MHHHSSTDNVADGDDAGSRAIRQMGCHEAYQLAMHTLDQYRGTIVACRYCPPSGLSLESIKESVLDAIVGVVLAQPHLQVGIVGENSKNPKFLRIDRLDLHHHVDWRVMDDSIEPEPQRLALMQSQLDARYSHLSTRPGWKVFVLHQVAAKSIEVLYVWNHPHHDGMSGKIFHQQLLQNLNKQRVQSEEFTQKIQQDSDGCIIINLAESSHLLPPPPEILTSWPMTATFLLKAIWKELKPYSIFPPSSTHATWAPIKTSPFATRFHTFMVNNDILQTVLGACREHHTTLTGLLHALTLLSLTTTLQDMNGFASRTPYDLRHFLPSETQKYPWLRPREAMCNYVSVLDHEFDTDLVATIRSKTHQTVDMSATLSPDVMEIVWSVSARVRREIQARLDSAVKNDMIGIMKFVSDWRTQQETEAQKPRYLSWLVTNLGILDGNINKEQHLEPEPEPEPELDQSWSICRAELLLSAEVPSAAISVSVMTVEGDKMCVTCSWQDCVVDANVGGRLIADLERWLNEIGS